MLDVLELLATGSHHLIGGRGECIISSDWLLVAAVWQLKGRQAGLRELTVQQVSAGATDAASRGSRRHCLDA